jgi:hypothetical protein
MTVVIPLTAKTPSLSRTKLLDNVLDCTDYYIRLFVNELDENNLEFIEASFLGYGQVKLDKNNWRDSIIESDLVVAYYKYPVAWSSIDASYPIVRGYYIVDSTNTVVWYQKFSNLLVLRKGRGLNIMPKIALGCVPTPTPQPTATRYIIPTKTPTPTATPTSTSTPTSTPTIEPTQTPTPPGYTFPPEQLSIGSFFKVSQSPDQFFVVKTQDPNIRLRARTAIFEGYQNVWLVGRVLSGQESYNSPGSLYIDPYSINIVRSEYPPNENYDLSFEEIQELLDYGFLSESSEVCFTFSGVTEEMEIKGILSCFLPLLWKTRLEIDQETNEFIQFGYCEGECPDKITSDYCESCVDPSSTLTVEEWNAQYQVIIQEIKDKIDAEEINLDEAVDRMLFLSRTPEEIQIDEDIAALDEYLDINSLLEGL